MISIPAWTLFDFYVGPVIELEELDDLYPDSEDESDETVNVSTEEVGSSEWASVPMSTFSDAPPPGIMMSQTSVEVE